MNALLIVTSYHHQNTLQVARVMVEGLQARVAPPEETDPASCAQYDLIGLGSGIYSAKHHPRLLRFADSLPITETGKAFLFSTDGMPRFAAMSEEMLARKMRSDHEALRNKLIEKGYTIIGEFNCAGFNTNSFLKLFGGINKGRPNTEDMRRAASFAAGLSIA